MRPCSWNTFVHKILCKFLQPFWQITRRVSPCCLVVSIVIVIFSISAGSCDVLTRIELPVLSLLVNAGCNVRTTASCDTDVGDVGVAVLDELVDKPGTTCGT